MPTKIEWCDETINPIRTADGGYHCTKISEGCLHCYAERINICEIDTAPLRRSVEEAKRDEPGSGAGA